MELFHFSEVVLQFLKPDLQMLLRCPPGSPGLQDASSDASPDASQMPPRRLQMLCDASRYLQMPSICFQMPPKCFQMLSDATRCLLDASQMLPDAFRCFQMNLRSLYL